MNRPPASHQAGPPLQKARKRPLSRLIWATVWACGFFTAALTMLWISLNPYLWDTEDDLRRILHLESKDNTLVLDSTGQKIGEFFSQYHVFVPYSDIPDVVKHAIVAIEDRNFWNHSGVDPRAIVRALYADMVGGLRFRQGASTITQQLVRQFLLTREKTILRKLKEIILAIQLEQRMSKERILEMYLNAMYLGHGAYGVGAAAQRYFGKTLNSLDPWEAALIAGLFQSPSRYNPQRNPKVAKRRQNQVINAMVSAGYASSSEALTWKKTALTYTTYQSLHGNQKSYFVDYVRQEAQKILKLSEEDIENSGFRIYTTLNPLLQDLAEKAGSESQDVFLRMERHLGSNERGQNQTGSGRAEAALLATDPRSGAIMAMVGGRDYQHSQFNRTVAAKRSPGSAFKPIAFSTALEKGYRWSDVIFVEPVTVGDFYRPHTPTSEYLTETTLLRAFYRSMNGPAVELGQKVGIRNIIQRARDFGFNGRIAEEFGVMLGGFESTLLELATAYGTFASKGVKIEPVSIVRIEDRMGNVVYTLPDASSRQQRVLAETHNFMMVKAMQNVLSHGTANRAESLAKKWAGKTGTSNGSRDNWFCGFSPNLVAITWVGNDQYLPIVEGDGTGATLALPIWQRFIENVQKSGWIVPDFEQPDGVEKHFVNPRFGHVAESGIEMWFLPDRPPDAEASDLERVEMQGSFRSLFNP